MDDLLLTAGLGVLVLAAWRTSETLGLVVLGAVLVLLSIAFHGTKLPRPRLKFKIKRGRR